MNNTNLHGAKKAKNDEFYTQLSDIENELRHYKKHFEGKVVLCNCNDALHSNFAKYFSLNFEVLGLKKLICTAYKVDGEHGKVCIYIIGNMNAITYKEIFPLIKENKMWLGVTNFNQGMYFLVDDDFIYAKTYKFDKEKNGHKVSRVAGVCWFTNLDHNKRHEKLDLYKKYNAEEYPKYDNYDAINVNNVCEIPMDFNGVIGVPITFLDKYNPTQFEIIRFRKGNDDKDLSVKGKCPYFRILIKKVF